MLSQLSTNITNQNYISTLKGQTLNLTDLPKGLIGELFNNEPEGGLKLAITNSWFYEIFYMCTGGF